MDISTLTPEQLQEHVVKAAEEIPGWAWPHELHQLFQIAQNSRCHVEIGSYCGKSLWAFAHGMPQGSTIHTIDKIWLPHGLRNNLGHLIYENPDDEWVVDQINLTIKYLRKQRPDLFIEFHRNWSKSIALEFAEKGIKADTIYLDGCHASEHIEADILHWLPLVNKGGIIFGHDYYPMEQGVVDTVNKIFNDKFYIVEDTRIWVHEVP